MKPIIKKTLSHGCEGYTEIIPDGNIICDSWVIYFLFGEPQDYKLVRLPEEIEVSLYDEPVTGSAEIRLRCYTDSANWFYTFPGYMGTIVTKAAERILTDVLLPPECKGSKHLLKISKYITVEVKKEGKPRKITKGK